jgi:ABC-type transport system involved in multi-copper enzyme maturation permease subunit
MLLTLVQNEISKALRSKLPYFGLCATALISFMTYIVAQHDSAGVINGWGYVGLSMMLVFTDIGLIFVIVFAAMLMADETRSGTIRAVLTGPLLRWELYVAKAVTGMLYMLLLSLIILLISIGLGSVRLDFGPVGDDYGEVYSRAVVAGNFLLAWFLSWIPLGTTVLYGLLVSVLIRSPGAAVAVGIGTVYIIDFTKHLVGLEPYIFTKYISYPWQILLNVSQGVTYEWTPEIWSMLGLTLGTSVVTFAAGLILFVHQDLN